MVLRHKCKWASSDIFWACKFSSRAYRAFPWEKGGCLGAWESSPSSGRSLCEVSSTQGSLPKISRHCSVKVLNLPAMLHLPGSQLSWSIWTLFCLLSAPHAVMGSSWDRDAPAHFLDCGIHVCSSRRPVSTILRHGLCSPASCQSTCTLLMKVF